MEVQPARHHQLCGAKGVQPARREAWGEGWFHGRGNRAPDFGSQGCTLGGKTRRTTKGTPPPGKGGGKGRSACGTGEGTPKAIAAGTPSAEGSRTDPWTTKEERRDHILKRHKLLVNAKIIGLEEEAAAEIQAMIDKLQKEVESTNLFLERARKRLANAEDEVAEALETLQKKQEAVV